MIFLTQADEESCPRTVRSTRNSTAIAEVACLMRPGRYSVPVVWPFRNDAQPEDLHSWLAREMAKEALKNPPWPPPERPDAGARILDHAHHLSNGASVSEPFLGIFSAPTKMRWIAQKENPAEALSTVGTPPCVTTYCKSGPSFERLGGRVEDVLTLAQRGNLSGPSQNDEPTIDIVKPSGNQGPALVFVNVNSPVDKRPILEPRPNQWNAPLWPVRVRIAGCAALLGATMPIVIGASFLALTVSPPFEAIKGPVRNTSSSVLSSPAPTKSPPTLAEERATTDKWLNSLHRLVGEAQQMLANDGKLDVDAFIHSAKKLVKDAPADILVLSLLSVTAGLTTATFWGRERYHHVLRERNFEAITPMASIVEGIRDLHWVGDIQPAQLGATQRAAWEALFSVRSALMNPPADLRSLEPAERIANETLTRLVKPSLLRLAESAQLVAKAKPARSEGLDALTQDLIREVRFWLSSVPQCDRPSVCRPPPAAWSSLADRRLGKTSPRDSERIHEWLIELAATLNSTADALPDEPHRAVLHLRRERFEDRIHMYWTLTALVLSELSCGESATHQSAMPP